MKRADVRDRQSSIDRNGDGKGRRDGDELSD